jgi:hypothetical protein
MLVEFVSVVDAVRCAVDFSAVWASRRSPSVSLRAPHYPNFTSREETVAAVEEAAADWGGPVWASTRLMGVVFLRSGATRSKPGGKARHHHDHSDLHATLHRHHAHISTHPARDLIVVGRRFPDFEIEPQIGR